MIRVARALWPPLVRGLLLVHLGALGLLCLVVSVERQAAHASAEGLFTDVLGLWGRLVAALTLLGCALAAARARRTLLTLGTLGLGAGAMARVALPLGALLGAAALLVPGRSATSDWERAIGGWLHRGQPVPDVLGGVVTSAPAAVAWPVLLACCLAAPLGARQWAAGPLALLVVANILADAAAPGGGAAVLFLGAVLVVVGGYSQPRMGAS